MTHSFGAPIGRQPYLNLPLPESLCVLLHLAFYGSPFWTAALWLTRYLLPGHGLSTLTTGIFLTFTAIFYGFFRILWRHVYRLKANRSPNWIAWHLLALLFLTALPAGYCFQVLQPVCQSLGISPDIAAIPAVAFAWQLTRHYRLLP